MFAELPCHRSRSRIKLPLPSGGAFSDPAFDIGASNGPVEAINGRLEHLRGIALGFKNLNHYILRCLIYAGQLQNKINAL